ncbi:hypothetical protein CRUP_000957, partial [Coryphaenoides rupestris]
STSKSQLRLQCNLLPAILQHLHKARRLLLSAEGQEWRYSGVYGIRTGPPRYGHGYPYFLAFTYSFPASNCPEECRCDRTFVYCNERSLTSGGGGALGIGEATDGWKNCIWTINSISTVGVEEGAVSQALQSKDALLTKNHLSSVAHWSCDWMKIASLSSWRRPFRECHPLERLLLDGNLLTDEGLRRGHSGSGEVLVKLNFQENQINNIPAGAFAGRWTQGVFDSLVSLRQLTVRNNLWLCDCSIQWVVSWLKSLPGSLNVRGFMCQKPEKVRGMVIRELSGELLQCPQRTTTPTLTSHLPTMPGDSASTLPSSSSPDCPLVTRTSPLPPGAPRPPRSRPICLSTQPDRAEQELRGPWSLKGKACRSPFTVLNGSAIHCELGGCFPSHRLQGDLGQDGPKPDWRTPSGRGWWAETTGGIRLPNLEPKSTYRICVIPLDVFNNYRPKMIQVHGATRGPEQATQPDPSSPFLLAGLIGGAVIVVLVVLLSIFCWHMHKKDRSKSSADWKYNRGRRKDDYCEAGTKKDNSILEMTETSFQIVSLNNEQLLKGDFRIQPIYTPNGGTGFRDCPLGTNSTVYCKNNVQDADLCHT